MCTTSALQDADKLKVARVRFRQGTDESPLILNNELMKVASRLGKNMHVQFFLSGITCNDFCFFSVAFIAKKRTHAYSAGVFVAYVEGPEIGRLFLAHLVHDAGLVVVTDNTKKSEVEMLLAILKDHDSTYKILALCERVQHASAPGDHSSSCRQRGVPS